MNYTDFVDIVAEMLGMRRITIEEQFIYSQWVVLNEEELKKLNVRYKIMDVIGVVYVYWEEFCRAVASVVGEFSEYAILGVLEKLKNRESGYRKEFIEKLIAKIVDEIIG